VHIPYQTILNGHFRCTAHTACLGDDPAILQQRFLSRAYKERYFEYQQGCGKNERSHNDVELITAQSISPCELALVLQIKDHVSKGGP
jgi:hypothetical protein